MSQTSTEELDALISRLDKIEPANLTSVQRSRYCYLQSLLKRIENHAFLLPHLVEKATSRLIELETMLEQTRNDAKGWLISLEHEDVYEEANALFKEGKFLHLKQLYEQAVKKNSQLGLSGLILEIDTQSNHLNILKNSQDQASNDHLNIPTGKQEELKSFKVYQEMFDKMALDRLLARVMDEIPENAGPLNPERLVIRSFQALQTLAPAYLSDLIAYYESLLRLQQIAQVDR